MKGIALCGFMGCGKTTVANALSKHYGLKHIDTDKYIEETEKITISQMFEKYGESYFRDKEFEAISALSQKGDCVLALGGGAVTFDRNVTALKNNGYTLVFINTDLDVIKKRLKNDTTRPLLKSNNIDTLYNKRLPIYSNASDITINCSDESGEQVAKMIMDHLK